MWAGHWLLSGNAKQKDVVTPINDQRELDGTAPIYKRVNSIDSLQSGPSCCVMLRRNQFEEGRKEILR